MNQKEYFNQKDNSAFIKFNNKKKDIQKNDEKRKIPEYAKNM